MTVSETVIDFGKLIAPAYYPMHRDIVKEAHTYYDLYGGRGGLKSSFISLEIILGMMKDKDANAAIFRKYGVTLRESVYEQILWAIDELGVAHMEMRNKSNAVCLSPDRTEDNIPGAG